MIIFRYLSKEVYMSLGLVTGVLLLIFISNQFVRYLSQAAAGKMSAAIVFKIMSIQVPFLTGLLLPVGFFLGILLAYGRFYVDSEMTVLTACGMSRGKLLQMTLWMSVVVILAAAVLNLYVSPLLMAYKDKMMAQADSNALVQTIIPGRFQVTNGGKTVYYIEKLSRSKGDVQHIFVAQRDKNPQQKTWSVMAARRGYQMTDSKSHDRFVVAVDGHRYFGKPGDKQFKMVSFGEYGVRLPNVLSQMDFTYEGMSTLKLLALYFKDPKAAAELQWRLSIPLSIPILVLLAVPLSRVRPRKGRYAQLLPSILIYSIYGNMMFVAKDWVARGTVSIGLGMWWLHGALLLIALWFYLNPRIKSYAWLRLPRWRSA